jgi:transketolase C-terminal domain/subunit
LTDFAPCLTCPSAFPAIFYIFLQVQQQRHAAEIARAAAAAAAAAEAEAAAEEARRAQAEVLRQGSNIMLWALGPMVQEALKLAPSPTLKDLLERRLKDVEAGRPVDPTLE